MYGRILKVTLAPNNLSLILFLLLASLSWSSHALCRLNSDCEVGQQCVNGTCGHKSCTDHSECRGYSGCYQNICQAISCTNAAEHCSAGQACLNGFCVDGECGADSDCSLGEVCIVEGYNRYSTYCAVDTSADRDRDGVPDNVDNCQDIQNSDQEDLDSDGQGDVCDLDDDGDGHADTIDNCPRISNPDQSDRGGTVGLGDACEPDSDEDGVKDDIDNCQTVVNPRQQDFDEDGIGDACDPDDDNDGLPDTSDSCPLFYDVNGVADVCEDQDKDGVPNALDNCMFPSDPLPMDSFPVFFVNYLGDTREGSGFVVSSSQAFTCIVNAHNQRYCYSPYNPSQRDLDGDRFGDSCDADLDGDGVSNYEDNCVYTPNTDQNTGALPGQRGYACDDDDDDDGVLDYVDNCPLLANKDGQLLDEDNDGIGDACDRCPGFPSLNNLDSDGDGIGDVCDYNPDIDGDGWLNYDDNCPGRSNPGQEDSNTDGIGDACG